MDSSHPGNSYLPFAQLVHLEQVDERTYRSTAPPFSPGGDVGIGRAYGGHVYMQAAWAACQTVGSGFLLHHVSGNFLLPGLTNLPFIYKVHLIRDGRSYATRILNVTQALHDAQTEVCWMCHATVIQIDNHYFNEKGVIKWNSNNLRHQENKNVSN